MVGPTIAQYAILFTDTKALPLCTSSYSSSLFLKDLIIHSNTTLKF